MKRLLLIGIVSLGGCRTPVATQDGQPTAEIASMDPFATVEAWIDGGARSAEVAETMSLNAPRVERMHRTDSGYVALVAGDAGPNALLLTLQKRDGRWTIISVLPERSDYLWPTQ